MKKIISLLLTLALLASALVMLFSCGETVTSETFTRVDDGGASYTLVKNSDNTFEMTVVEQKTYDTAALAAIGISGEGVTTLTAKSTFVYTGSWSESEHAEDDGETVTSTSLSYSTAKRTVELSGDAKEAYLAKMDALLEELYESNVVKYTVVSEEKNDEGAVTNREFELVQHYRDGVQHTADKPTTETVECNAEDNTFKPHVHED